ncbi:MAG: protease family protein [Frankiaceae bacterium]|jgi:membrane protease YdiL (CAAX protease family)|nr:protease family protein [Frankiaceae bacterium]MDQ1650687.1 protease family protein [Frankiaceae bacterium]MDQ1672411.1 protease family protein [Frankiaceae bacterium]
MPDSGTAKPAQPIQRWVALLPDWLVEKVPRDHREPDAAFARRRRIVAGVAVVGSGLLGVALSSDTDSPRFYAASLGVATTWVVGGFLSGPLHRGWMPAQAPDAGLHRPLVTPVATGVGMFGFFYGGALVARRIPVLDAALRRVLRFADSGFTPGLLFVTLANGVGEEVFFRGAMYAAIGEKHPIQFSTLGYTMTTVATRNPALVLAAGVMGTLFGLQRRSSGGIQAPLLTHMTWSALMLKYLPPLFR